MSMLGNASKLTRRSLIHSKTLRSAKLRPAPESDEAGEGEVSSATKLAYAIDRSTAEDVAEAAKIVELDSKGK